MPARPTLRSSRTTPELKGIRIAPVAPDLSGGMIRIKGRSGGELDITLAPGGRGPKRRRASTARVFGYLPPFIKGAGVEQGRIMLRAEEGQPFRVIILDDRNRVISMRQATRITGSDDLWQCAIPSGIQRCMKKFIISKA
jgi:hypothetical protein